MDPSARTSNRIWSLGQGGRREPALRPPTDAFGCCRFRAREGLFMKLLVVGATGGTGRSVLTAALEAGHEVTAFARWPSAVELKHPKLRVAEGDVLKPETVSAAVAGQDAVVSALGPSKGTPPGTLISEGIRNVLAAMSQHQVRRLVFESGLMVGDGSELALPARWTLAFFRRLNQALYEDKVRA